MRPETKALIKEKLINSGVKEDMIHARDIRSIINCETELLQKTIEKWKDIAESEQMKLRVYRSEIRKIMNLLDEIASL